MIAVFAPLAWCDFTDWDDAGTITANPYLNPPTLQAVQYYWTTIGEKTPGQLFTPVTYTVWAGAAAVSDMLFGRAPDVDGIRLHPVVFHSANVSLHALATLLAFRLLRQLFRRDWAAAAGALLFALHPVQVESVAWVSGTKDILCGMLSIGALSAYVSAVRRSEGGIVVPSATVASTDALTYATPARRTGRRSGVRRRYLLATGLFLLAMLSKPTALMVPPMAAAIDLLLLGRSWRRALAWLWPWALLMVPCILWTRAAQPAPWASPIALWQRPLVATDAVAFYLCKLAWPAHLCVDYGRRPGTVVASGTIYWTWVLPVTVLAIAGWRWKRSLPKTTEPSGSAAGSAAPGNRARTRGRAAGPCAFALFVLPLVPVLGLVPFDFQFYSTVADHYLYLSMLGVAVAATWGLTTLSAAGGPPTVRWLTPAATTVVLLALAVRSIAQMPTWRTTTTLFQHVLSINPRSFAACDQLGHADVKLAQRLRRGRPTVPPTDPDYPAWRADLERSLGWYYRALSLYDGYVPALVNIATNAGQLGRPDEQRAALRRVVALQPSVPLGLRADPIELAQRLLAAGDPATALQVLDRVLRADPTNVPAMLLRNRALAVGSQ